VAREFDSKRNYTRLKALFDGLAEEQTGKQEAVKNRSHI
jgi:hypothetical protein